MKRLKIGVDVDGVLANFVEAFRHEAQDVLGRKIEGPSRDWGFTNWMNGEEQSRVWGAIKNSKDWFELYPTPLPGVIKDLPKLCSGHEVYFVTTRIQTLGKPIQRQTQFWLDDVGVEFPTVIVTPEKGPIVAALKLDAFIDDRPENLENISDHSQNTRLYLQDASYNTTYSDTKWTRVPTFAAFVDKVL